MPLNNYTFRCAGSLARRDKVLKLLESGQRKTRSELAELTGIGINAMHAYLADMMSQDLIHIHSWQRNSPGSPSPVYAFGKGKNAEKPKPMTNAEKKRKHRKCADVREAEAMQKRARRIKPYRDPVTAALFGQA